MPISNPDSLCREPSQEASDRFPMGLAGNLKLHRTSRDRFTRRVTHDRYFPETSSSSIIRSKSETDIDMYVTT